MRIDEQFGFTFKPKRRYFLSLFTTIFISLAGCEKFGNGMTTGTSEERSIRDGEQLISGERKIWHRVTINFDGPSTSETADPNPFLNYRLDVMFEGPSGQTYKVPGFYAGDGEGGGSGNKWSVRFAPDEAGDWSYTAFFRQGEAVAVQLDNEAGLETAFDGAHGTFTVDPSDKNAPDHRSKGRLRNDGSHYLQRADGTRWLKGGLNIPENFLAYAGFDNMPEADKTYSVHESDWNLGDPNWGDGDGKGIIGALNFIAKKGGNSIYFLPLNIGGDGDDTWPTIGKYEKTRYDNSKLRQWEIVFTHAQAKGIHLHFQLSETESANERYHDDGNLGPERKLYYRELIARFGHHNAIQFNLGEEIDYSLEKRKAFANYLGTVDPYDHPVTVHNHVSELENTFTPHVRSNDLDMTSFQTKKSQHSLASLVEKYRKQSADNNTPWIISIDETQKIEADKDDQNAGLPHGRRDKLWPVYMSGGGGFEWYIQHDGGGHSLDQQLENFNRIDPALEWTKYALDFMETIPYWEMEPVHDTIHDVDGYGLAKRGNIYAYYLPEGGSSVVDLADGAYSLRWYNPRTGDFDGAIQAVTGGRSTNLPAPPFGGDAVALVERKS